MGKEMVDAMRQAVETRNDGRLQFLSKLFKNGSVSRLLVQSHARVVWMNDWYPLKDLTYAISSMPYNVVSWWFSGGPLPPVIGNPPRI